LQQRLAAGEDVPPVTFVGIGVGNRPNGGIAKRLDGLVIPFFDFSFNGASPDNPAFPIPTIDIARQYDGLADTPQFILNPVADLNAILGVVFVHTLYGEEVSLDPNSPKYVPGTVRQQDGDTTYYWIPTPDLPLFDPLRLIGVPEKIIDIFEPFFRVLVEAGYDRTVPFGEPTPAQLIPVVDPITLANDLVGAVIEGLNNAAKIVGAQLPGYAALRERLSTVRSTSATVIGAPYRDVVSSINETVNPILAFNQIEGPVVSAFNDVVNGVGVPALLNGFIDPVLPPITAWAERNVLFPQPDVRSIPPAARVARQLLAPVAPALATDPSPANGTESAAAFEDPATSAAIPADPSATNARQHHQATTFTPHAHAETNSSTTGLGSVGTPAHSAASRHTSITPTGTPRPASTASTAAGGAGAKANAGSSGAAGAA
jgi:hypothetical protein